MSGKSLITIFTPAGAISYQNVEKVLVSRENYIRFVSEYGEEICSNCQYHVAKGQPVIDGAVEASRLVKQ